MTQGLPLVSVVTPVHNEEQHISECIESVLAQTYSNWEYTIVDNCSADRTLEIARHYASKDSRIRVHANTEFLKVIPNHNAALRQISTESKYCKVVFGDDWISPNCLTEMVALAEANPTVGIVGSYALEGTHVAWTGLPYPSTVVSGREICRRHLVDKLYLFGSANTVLYRSDLVRGRDHFYNEKNIHADTEVCFALLKTCDFGFIHQILSFSRVRPCSLATVSGELATSFPGMLQLLSVHAPNYLTEDERKAKLEELLHDYYRFLGKCVLLGRNTSFWKYHKRALTEAGIGLSSFYLAKGAIAALGSAALHPKTFIQNHFRTRFKQEIHGHRSSNWRLSCSSAMPENADSCSTDVQLVGATKQTDLETV